MNIANLQLEGLYLVLAALNNALVAKGLMSREEMDLALRVAEETAAADRSSEDLNQSNRDALAFPARLLRLANNGGSDGQILSFSELAKMVGRLKDASPEAVDDADAEQVFYASENGDKWVLFTDVGGRRFVRHIPANRSGGQISITELESFRERDPHSPQNQRLEELLRHSAF